MELAAILAILKSARDIIAYVSQQAELGRQNGTFTPEQLEQIRAEATIVDAEWDQRVAEAKARIAAQG